MLYDGNAVVQLREPVRPIAPLLERIELGDAMDRTIGDFRDIALAVQFLILVEECAEDVAFPLEIGSFGRG